MVQVVVYRHITVSSSAKLCEWWTLFLFWFLSPDVYSFGVNIPRQAIYYAVDLTILTPILQPALCLPVGKLRVEKFLWSVHCESWRPICSYATLISLAANNNARSQKRNNLEFLKICSNSPQPWLLVQREWISRLMAAASPRHLRVHWHLVNALRSWNSRHAGITLHKYFKNHSF